MRRGLDDGTERLHGQFREASQRGQRDDYGGDRIEDTAWSGARRAERGIEKLLTHPQIDVRIMAAVHGTRDQCRRVLAMPSSRHDITVVFMRDSLIERMGELDAVANAINFGKTKSRKFENMEL